MTEPSILTNARVLVTGGAGFVGSHIIDALLGEGCAEITAIDNMVRGRPANLAAALRDPRVKIIEGDIRDHALMERLVAQSDVVFHQAALRITHCAAEPDQAMEVMVDATYDLLMLCVTHKVRRVVMASSASIYGDAAHFPTTEDEPPYPNRTLYGAAKSFGEGLLRSLNDMYELDYVALRYFNVYGPRMDIHGKYTEVMVRWMERVAAGKPPLIFGDGAQTMDLIDVRDVARANILAAKAPVSDAVYNVGSQTETSLKQLAHIMTREMGRPDLVPEHVEERSVNPVTRRIASAVAARSDLGFAAAIPVDAGLRDLIAWWREETGQVDAPMMAAGE
ncbi:SDR family NAD(P)-dependent oxidoreductase [Pseudooceanicola sp. LIPI14-2-Ac024]|uniref:SDR family NAD(P)-dependent oxidoreductase n=1 Tax=Pseudooceanicola sp. LIPI14-2-Ac024 TaxID=3344875 RepID=UPI0035CEA542